MKYHYRVALFEVDDVNERFFKVYEKLYHRLGDVAMDFPQYSVKELRYVADRDCIFRLTGKYKGLRIDKQEITYVLPRIAGQALA